MDEKLVKEFKRYPDAFWMDIILFDFKSSINGTMAFGEKAISYSFVRIMENSEGGVFFRRDDISGYISTLLDNGHIKDKGDNRFQVTHKGISHIMVDGGYLALARKKRREDKRWDLEYYRIGYDSLLSLAALVLSILAYLTAKGIL